MRIIRIIIIFLPLLSGCKSTQTLSGAYGSNFAVIGFFGTKFQFRTDSTFDYWYAGDLMSDKATGTYQINEKVILLNYDEQAVKDRFLVRENSIGQVDTIFFTNPAAVLRPKKLKIRGDKLFEIKDNGKIVKREQGFSRIRKYIFWGDHFMTNRRYFLKKIE